MSNDGLSSKERFDRMSVDIGTGLLNVQMMITEFVIELLKQYDALTCELDLLIPHQFSEDFVNVKITGISYDSELNELVIKSEKSLKWDELNIIAQDLIATHLHIAYTSQNFLSELS